MFGIFAYFFFKFVHLFTEFFWMISQSVPHILLFEKKNYFCPFLPLYSLSFYCFCFSMFRWIVATCSIHLEVVPSFTEFFFRAFFPFSFVQSQFRCRSNGRLLLGPLFISFFFNHYFFLMVVSETAGAPKKTKRRKKNDDENRRKKNNKQPRTPRPTAFISHGRRLSLVLFGSRWFSLVLVGPRWRSLVLSLSLYS